MLDRFRLDGTTAIVTGGSRNMGRVFSLALADAGANVAIVDLPQQADAAVDVAREVETRGRRATFAPLDLRSPEDIPACRRADRRRDGICRNSHQQCRQDRRCPHKRPRLWL